MAWQLADNLRVGALLASLSHLTPIWPTSALSWPQQPPCSAVQAGRERRGGGGGRSPPLLFMPSLLPFPSSLYSSFINPDQITRVSPWVKGCLSSCMSPPPPPPPPLYHPHSQHGGCPPLISPGLLCHCAVQQIRLQGVACQAGPLLPNPYNPFEQSKSKMPSCHIQLYMSLRWYKFSRYHTGISLKRCSRKRSCRLLPDNLHYFVFHLSKPEVVLPTYKPILTHSKEFSWMCSLFENVWGWLSRHSITHTVMAQIWIFYVT